MYDFLNDKNVAVYINENLKEYPIDAPYNPSQYYPEYILGNHNIAKENNDVYDGIRNLLYMLNMDISNYGTSKWNPLKEIIKPGNMVVIKPNFVLDKHECGGNLYSVITHPSIIRAIVDYVYIALNGNGEIIICDAPEAGTDFDNLINVTKLFEIKKIYKLEKGFDIKILDLRQLKFVYKDGILTKESRIDLNGDPLGYTIFNLKNNSEFDEFNSYDKIYGADYDRNETISHHNHGKHEYCIANTILCADVIISIPKLKTHRKAGVTLNLKNFVGINGNKNYLPHFRIGTPGDGGDEYPELNNKQRTVFYTQRKLIDKLLTKPNKLKENIYKVIYKSYKLLKPILFKSMNSNSVENAGSWYGNDTIWRMILDLNKLLIYGSKDGNLHEDPQRKLFCVVDGIISGEGNGPLAPDAKPCGLLAAGINYLLVDFVLIDIIGFDSDKIPQYRQAKKLCKYKITNVDVKDIHVSYNMDIYDEHFQIPFIAAKGWKGYIETN